MAGVPQCFGVGSTQGLTDAATIDLHLDQAANNIPPSSTIQIGTGNAYSVTLGGNRTLNVYGMVPGQIVHLYVTQDGTGSRTLTVQLNGVASTVLTSGTPLTTTAGALDLVALEYRATLGKVMYYSIAKNFV